MFFRLQIMFVGFSWTQNWHLSGIQAITQGKDAISWISHFKKAASMPLRHLSSKAEFCPEHALQEVRAPEARSCLVGQLLSLLSCQPSTSFFHLTGARPLLPKPATGDFKQMQLSLLTWHCPPLRAGRGWNVSSISMKGSSWQPLCLPHYNNHFSANPSIKLQFVINTEAWK